MINNYQELAEKICFINEMSDCDNKDEIIKSIKSQFYAIEGQLEEELKIPVKKYRISQRIELIEYMYIYKNYYYSREQIIDFIEKFYVEIKEGNIFDRFLKFKGVNRLFKKEYENLLLCEKICFEEENKEMVLNKNEVNIIKNINNCNISDALENDLKKYYFRTDLGSDKKYGDYTLFINDMQLDMSIQYDKFIKRLQHGFYYEDRTDKDKKVIYDELSELLNKLDKIIDGIKFMDSENKQDLMAIFYIRLKRNDIGKYLNLKKNY